MKLTDEERAEFRSKLAKSARERSQAKADLVAEARLADEESRPEYLEPDGNDDAWFHRKSQVNDLIKRRGGFSHHVALLALTDPDWETKETVATWLREELKRLRKAEAQPGAAPVRRQQTLSRSEIADVAVELLECVAGKSLICLFQELLDIDRRRRALSEAFVQIDKAAEVEATTQLQGRQLGVRQMAKYMGVAPSTVTRWRTASNYSERVKFHKSVWGGALREEYFETIKGARSEATEAECFQRAFQMYYESLPQRRAWMSRSNGAPPNAPKRKRKRAERS